MASKQRKATHLIPNSLTHSAGIITAVFDSGTRQVTLSGLTANTLYFLYLRTVSGTPTLFSVTTTPQTYRVSFPEAILIGAFYANGNTSVAFGSFVTIEGVPTSGSIPYNLVIGAVTTPPTEGAGATKTATWRQVGDVMEIVFTYQQNAAGSAGSGTYLFPTPSGMSVDTTRATVTTNGSGLGGTVLGPAFGGNVTAAQTAAASVGNVYAYNSTNLWLGLSGAGSSVSGSAAVGSASLTLGNNPLGLAFTAPLVPITGWSNTPLKDR